MMACAREEIIVSETSVQDTPIGMQAQKGRLRLKFKSRFAGKAEQAVYTRAGTGDIRIVSMKRLFPFAGKFEERTRKAGLHLWYEVEFDEQTPVTRALALLGDTTEIEIAEPVYIIRNTGGEGTVPVRSAGERNSDGTAPFNDPALTTVAYRIGDSATNAIAPISSDVALIVGLLGKYNTDKSKTPGMGTVFAGCMPYAIATMITELLILGVWWAFNLPLGPGVTMFIK